MYLRRVGEECPGPGTAPSPINTGSRPQDKRSAIGGSTDTDDGDIWGVVATLQGWDVML